MTKAMVRNALLELLDHKEHPQEAKAVLAHFSGDSEAVRGFMENRLVALLALVGI